MLKRILKVSIVFMALFCFKNVNAYDYINQSNAGKVESKINSIFESRELYRELFEIGEGQFNLVSSDMMWWPIGSIETVTINGELFAPGEPHTVSTSDGFGCFAWRANKEKGETCGWHNGLDISGLGLPPGTINIIAVKDGEVIYPTAEYQRQYKDHTGSAYRNGDGGGLGNYVIIRHSDGTQSVYGHMAQNSITVMAGDVVRQGQVIGKVGHTGSSTAAHLHFGIKVNGAYVDPLEYIDPTNPRPQGTNSSFILAGTILSRSEFIAKMKNYCDRSKNESFCNNFSDKAGEIYDVSKDNNINPELVVVKAGAETSWSLSSECAYTNNYWGIGLNDKKPCNSGGIFSSLAEGIAAYAKTIKGYDSGGNQESLVTNIYNTRSDEGCDFAGHGKPGTIEGMQSAIDTQYTGLGEYRYDPGNADIGGCYYLDQIYSKGYCSVKPSCTDYSNCSIATKTTVCEQNDYTAWRLKKQYSIRYDIFGL